MDQRQSFGSGSGIQWPGEEMGHLVSEKGETPSL